MPSDDFMARSIKSRKQLWIEEMRQIQRDAEHWNRTHPDEEPIVIEPITEAEIKAFRDV